MSVSGDVAHSQIVQSCLISGYRGRIGLGVVVSLVLNMDYSQSSILNGYYQEDLILNGEGFGIIKGSSATSQVVQSMESGGTV